MAKEQEPRWEKARPQRQDLKNILKNTKKLEDMYLQVLQQKKAIWENYLEEEKKKAEKNGPTT